MRALLVVGVGLISVGCQCGPGQVADAGAELDSGIANVGGGGGGLGGGSGGGAGGGSGGGGGGEVDGGPDTDAGTDAGFDGGPTCSLTATPTALAFGSTVPGCVATELITIQNTCSADEPFAVLTTGPFSTDAGSLSVPAGGTVVIPVSFSPTALGAATGTANVAASTTVLAIPLSGLGGDGVLTDTFRVPTQVRANMLFIISDGPGMSAAQTLFAQNVSSLAQYAGSNGVDFRMGVASGRPDGGALVGVVRQSTPSAGQRLIDYISLGSSGAPTVSCLERAVELLSADSTWLYPRASFALVCLQNTLEQTPASPAVSLQALTTLAGDPAHFSVNAVANFVPGCAAPDDAILRDLVDAGRGELASICPSDAGSGGLTLRGTIAYEDTFFLSRVADPMSPIEVRIDGVLVPPIDPTLLTTIWTYDAARNTIVFMPLYVPEPGKTLTVRYTARCTP